MRRESERERERIEAIFLTRCLPSPLHHRHRSFKISKQIKDLQEVLTSLQIPYKNNKFSVLMSAVDFISEIQRENSNAVMHNAAMKNILVQANEFLKRLKEGGEK